MMSKKLLAVVIILIATISGYFYFANRGNPDLKERPVIPSVSGSSERKTSANSDRLEAEKVTVIADINDPYRLLKSGKTVAQALDESMISGDNSSRAYSLLNTAWVFCRGDYDPVASLSDKKVDKTRLWAIDRLSKLCEGFEPSKYKFDVRPSFNPTLYKKDPERAVVLANQAIKSGIETQEIFDAAMMLIENDRIPMNTFLPNEQDYGRADLTMPLVNATSMLACTEADSCDGYALQTLNYCMVHGCVEGSNLHSAYQRNLSPRDYEMTMAIFRWLQAQRRKK
jgi:hypothetical protein